MADYTYQCRECDKIFKKDEYDFVEEPSCPVCKSDDCSVLKKGKLDGIVYNCNGRCLTDEDWEHDYIDMDFEN